MALEKPVTLTNGVIVNYHRIVSISNVTNINTGIEIASYVNKEKRNEEKNLNVSNMYVRIDFLNMHYDEQIGISAIYEYLKTLEKYEGAIDA